MELVSAIVDIADMLVNVVSTDDEADIEVARVVAADVNNNIDVDPPDVDPVPAVVELISNDADDANVDAGVVAADSDPTSAAVELIPADDDATDADAGVTVVDDDPTTAAVADADVDTIDVDAIDDVDAADKLDWTVISGRIIVMVVELKVDELAAVLAFKLIDAVVVFSTFILPAMVAIVLSGNDDEPVTRRDEVDVLMATVLLVVMSIVLAEETSCLVPVDEADVLILIVIMISVVEVATGVVDVSATQTPDKQVPFIAIQANPSDSGAPLKHLPMKQTPRPRHGDDA